MQTHQTSNKALSQGRRGLRIGAKHTSRQVACSRQVVRATVTDPSGSAYKYPHFVPQAPMQEIADEDAHRMASLMRRVPVSMPSLMKDPLRTAVIGPTGDLLDAVGCAPDEPVMVLLHSFDSSSLEWRKLYPQLVDKAGMIVVAVDLIGWGFTDHQAWRRYPDLPVGPAQKREHLEAFRQQYLGGRPVVLVGTSLGGTIAADYALHYAEAVKGLVLIAAQGFTDGVTPLPKPLASLGVMVLRMVALRKTANQMAYFNKEKFATDDAWRVGRLSTYLPGWLEANVSFIRSGGYNMSESRIKQLRHPILLLWGRNDEIIPPKTAQKWQEALGPKKCKLVWVEESGHSPHIEQADFVATQVVNWLEDMMLRKNQQHEIIAEMIEEKGAAMAAEPPVVGTAGMMVMAHQQLMNN